MKNKQIYKINRTFLILIELFQIYTNKRKSKNQNWTLIQKPNGKENEKKTTNKQKLVPRSHFLPLVLFVGKKGKDLP